MRKMDVVVYNELGCELARQKVETQEQLETYIANILVAIEPGDMIKFEEFEGEE